MMDGAQSCATLHPTVGRVDRSARSAASEEADMQRLIDD